MTNPDYTHLAFIIDRSGSMSPIAADMDGQIKSILKKQGKGKGKLLVDAWTFDTVVDHPYKGVEAAAIVEDLIAPRGMTALNDAIGSCITKLGKRFKKMDEDERPGKVIVVIVTDGGENASHEFPGEEGREQIKKMVEKQQSKFSWEFLFFGASSIDAFGAASGYGVARSHTFSFDHSTVGTQNLGAAASGYITRSVAGDASGFTAAERGEGDGEEHEDTTADVKTA